MKNYLFPILCVLSILSCSTNDDPVNPETQKGDKVIFGGIYGMCAGDCRDLYMINKNGIYKDSDS